MMSEKNKKVYSDSDLNQILDLMQKAVNLDNRILSWDESSMVHTGNSRVEKAMLVRDVIERLKTEDGRRTQIVRSRKSFKNLENDLNRNHYDKDRMKTHKRRERDRQTKSGDAGKIIDEGTKDTENILYEHEDGVKKSVFADEKDDVFIVYLIADNPKEVTEELSQMNFSVINVDDLNITNIDGKPTHPMTKPNARRSRVYEELHKMFDNNFIIVTKHTSLDIDTRGLLKAGADIVVNYNEDEMEPYIDISHDRNHYFDTNDFMEMSEFIDKIQKMFEGSLNNMSPW